MVRLQSGYFRYVALSVFANFLILHAVNVGGVSLTSDSADQLRVSLRSTVSSNYIPKETRKENRAAGVFSSGEKRKETDALSMEGTASATVFHGEDLRLQTPPEYPSRALELGQEGTVIVMAKVDGNGLPVDLKVAQSSGYPLLDMSAVSAVRKWEFETSGAGKSFPRRVKLPIRFVIE